MVMVEKCWIATDHERLLTNKCLLLLPVVVFYIQGLGYDV